MEFRFFSNVYSQTHFFNQNRSRISQNNRTTYFTEIVQWSYGLNKRFNIGIDFLYKRVRIDPDQGSVFRVFERADHPLAQAGITGIGPKVRWVPFASFPRLNIQSTLYFPVKKDLEGQGSGKPFLDYDRLFLWTQINLDKMFGQKWQIYGGMDIWYRSANSFKKEDMILASPLKLIISYFPGRKSSLYTLSEITPTYGENLISSWYSQMGLGFKYFLTEHFESEFLVSRFVAGRNSGAGSTFNLGLRYLFIRK